MSSKGEHFQMSKFLLNLNFYFKLLLISCLSIANSFPSRHTQLPKSELELIVNGLHNYHVKHLPEVMVTDCMMVTSKHGHYYYKIKNTDYELAGLVCGIYIMADADEVIQIHFDYIDMPCESDGIVGFFDGWELNGSYIPSDEDYPKDPADRSKEYCGKKRVKQIFQSSQNAALIRYRVTKPGNGFSFYLTTKKNLRPCNVLVESESFVYTLRNYGKPGNCSLIAMNPTKIKILSLTVGIGDLNKSLLETGTYHNCDKNGIVDYVQIGGGVPLGHTLSTVDTICGLDSAAGRTVDKVFCGVTTIRLVSSGSSDNQVTVSIEKLSSNNSALPDLTCPSEISE